MSSSSYNLDWAELEVNAERVPEIDIGIVGGGLAGLALAVALQQRDIPCHVFETHPPSMTADTASIVGIGLNGIAALEGIKPGLSTALAQAGAYSTKIKLVAYTDIEVSTIEEKQAPGELMILTWKSVHRILVSFVNRTRISFSHKLLAYKPCKHYAGDYTLWSLRKTDQTGDVVNSVLAERTTHGSLGCKHRALQHLDGLELWDDLRSVIEATSEDIITERKIMDRLPLDKWSDADGHVLLIGDAAHAQFIGPGQGAMSAFEDVHQLSLLLEVARGSSFSEGSIQEAVKRFEELRIPRTKKMQEYAAYSSMIPDFQPEWFQHLTAEERLKVNKEYREWVHAYPNKQQGDPDSFYFK